jgi:hypothetical protein
VHPLAHRAPAELAAALRAARCNGLRLELLQSSCGLPNDASERVGPLVEVGGDKERDPDEVAQARSPPSR